MAQASERTLLRRRLIEELMEQRGTISELRRRYQVSRKTIHKWKERYDRQGWEGLQERSRRPHCSPRQASSRVWQEEVFELKRRHRRWGAKKLAAELQRRNRDKQLISLSTIGRLLRAAGLTHDRRRRSRKNGPIVHWADRPVAEGPNEVWSLDFKGDFCSADGQRLYPLTMEDLYSRFLLETRALSAISFAGVQACCRRVFSRYGLPKAIVVDNGKPFAGDGLLGLSRLSVWWLRLGIGVHFIERGKPYQNGRLERLHGTLKVETTQPPSANLAAQQRRFDRWRHHYNQERPHEALGQRYPGELYQAGSKKPSLDPAPLHYPRPMLERRVKCGAEFQFDAKRYFLSEALAGENIGLKPIAVGKFEIFWDKLLIALLEPAVADPIRLARIKRMKN
jgi:transposase InsO family protein